MGWIRALWRWWLRHELRPLVEDVLSAASMRRRGLFDADGVARLVRADRDGRMDAAYTIFAVVCIEVWRRTFIGELHNILGSSGFSVDE